MHPSHLLAWVGLQELVGGVGKVGSTQGAQAGSPSLPLRGDSSMGTDNLCSHCPLS